MSLSTGTYYSARVGFPNATFSNGRYNSLAVACAHTNMADEVLANSFTDISSVHTDARFVSIPGAIQVSESTRIRSLEILDILRGNKTGVLTEEDARVFCKTFQAAAKLYGEPLGYQPYVGTDEIKNDPKREKLKAAVNDPDWRVIRVKGNGHYWVFVRNPYGTVDVINDARITPNFLNINGITQVWSNLAEWDKTQISFYPPQKTDESLASQAIVYRDLELDSVKETRPVHLENCIVKGNVEAPNITMWRTTVQGNVIAGQEFSLDHVTIKGIFTYVLDPKNPNKEIHSSKINVLHIRCLKGFSSEYTGIPLLDLRGCTVAEISTDELENGIRIFQDGSLSRTVTMQRKWY